MKNQTRQEFNAFLSRQGELNSVDIKSGQQFSVEPSVEQRLEEKITEQSDFLSRINTELVVDITGEKLGLCATSPVSSRTDTDLAPRTTTDPTGISDDDYFCAKTDFDTHIKFQKLDKWAKFGPKFQTLWQEVVLKQQARDRLMVAFNGTSRADTTNSVDNPLLQDLNIGFLEKIRLHALRYQDGYVLGGAGNYTNIDALVMDIIASFIEPWHVDSGDLVVIAGRNLVTDKYTAMVDANDRPTEQAILKTMLLNKQLGNTPTITAPYFPADAFMVTPMDNLSIYVQEGSRRRTIKENPERDRIEDFQSANVDYVIEDYGACCLVDNITVPA